MVGHDKEYFRNYILEKYNYLWDINPNEDKPLPKDFKTMKFLDKKILGSMYVFDQSREESINTYYEDKKEVENIKRMDRTEFLEHLEEQKEIGDNVKNLYPPTEDVQIFRKVLTDDEMNKRRTERNEYCKRIIDDFFKSYLKTNTP